MQFRVPRPKGWLAARRSEKKGDVGSVRAGGSQRSGMKVVGRWKFLGESVVEIAWTETIVYGGVAVLVRCVMVCVV